MMHKRRHRPLFCVALTLWLGWLTAVASPTFVAAADAAANAKADVKASGRRLKMNASSFAFQDTGFYLDKGKWAAINPNLRKSARAEITFPYPTGTYDLTLEAVGENDGSSTYQVSIDDEALEPFTCPVSDVMFAEGKEYHRTWNQLQITEGAQIKIAAEIGSNDGKEFSRARWASVVFTPADDATRKTIAPILAKQIDTPDKSDNAQAKSSPTTPVSDLPLQLPQLADGDGGIEIQGELKQWHKVTLTLDGPYAHELDNAPNPFVNYEMNVKFTHESGTPSYTVPGYFAADGDAGQTSAQSGTKWRAHLSPDKAGKWNYSVDFHQGKVVVETDTPVAQPLAPFHGAKGQFTILPTDKLGSDLRAHGRLQYVGERYLKFGGTGEYFLKVGADAPETLLGYADFDGTVEGKPKVPLKTYAPHLGDYRDGDPTWQNGKGKGLIGAINYLSDKGCNAFSFLTYNAGGDGDNVWPFVQRNDKLHYDCSKLDQWGIVFDHGTNRGMYLHFKMQETENDDHRTGKNADGNKSVPESLDGGNLGIQRRLYCRELIARFGHNLALNWNLGEENTQSTAQQQDMINFIARLDPYGHNIVIHTFPNEQDKVYRPLLGNQSKLTGLSLQNSAIPDTHWQVVKWVRESQAAGKPWVVAFDESGSAAHAQCPDLGYKGYDGRDLTGKMTHTEHEVRRQTLWGALMGGGAGVEYYFGYQYVENDLLCEDWRSRDRSWDYCRIAKDFFHDNGIPFHQMQPADELVGKEPASNDRYCLAKTNDTYLVYVAHGDETSLDLTEANGSFTVQWFNPRSGGSLVDGTVKAVSGGETVKIGSPPSDVEQDWLAVIRKSRS